MDTCTFITGDSLLVGTETCDDGNTNNGDGCSFNSVWETGYSCDNALPSNCNYALSSTEKIVANVLGYTVFGFAMLLAVISFIVKGKVCSAFFNCFFSI
jgi:cysteine-rich repeat protein